jgi:hypothetical protein
VQLQPRRVGQPLQRRKTPELRRTELKMLRRFFSYELGGQIVVPSLEKDKFHVQIPVILTLTRQCGANVAAKLTSHTSMLSAL